LLCGILNSRAVFNRNRRPTHTKWFWRHVE